MTSAEIRRSFRSRLHSRSLWLVFAFVFLIYAGFPIWDYLRQGSHVSGMTFSGQIVSAFLFYVSFIWLSPLPWQWDGKPGLPRFSLPLVIRAFVACELLSLVLVYIDSLFRPPSNASELLGTYVQQACFQAPAWFVVGNLTVHRERTEAEKAEMRMQVLEAQDRHLRGQVHPHVLFNALNGLAELVHEDTLGAESHIRAMSTLLRRILEAGEVELYALSEERALVENYLQVESIRLGERLRVAWNWPLELDELLVPPLLIQPLVENAVKHGLVPVRGGGDLEIAARRDGKALALSVRNTGRPLPADLGSRSGIGIKNLRKRLELAYPGTASFQLHQDLGWTVAEIRLEAP